MPPEKPESQYKTVLYLSESSPTLALAKPLCNGFVNWHVSILKIWKPVLKRAATSLWVAAAIWEALPGDG